MKYPKTNDQADSSTLSEANIFEITDALTEVGDQMDIVFLPIYKKRIESQLQECSIDTIKVVVIYSDEENSRLCANFAIALLEVLEEKFEKMPDIIISSELSLERQKQWRGVLEGNLPDDFDPSIIKGGDDKPSKMDTSDGQLSNVAVSRVPTLVTLASKAHAKYLFTTMKGVPKDLQQTILKHMNTCIEEEDGKSAPSTEMKL